MKNLVHLLPLYHRYRRRIVFGISSIFLAVVVGLASPILVGRAVDTFEREPSMTTLLVYALLIVGVAAVRGVFTYAQRMILVTVSRDIENDLRNDYFAHLERLPQSFYHRHATGDLMARATNDLNAVRMLCGPAIMYASNTLFTAIGALVFMLAIHPGLTLVALASMPLVAIATKVFGQKIHLLFERVQDQFSEVTARVQENLSGLRVVRAFAGEEWEEQLFAGQNEEYVERNRHLIRWGAAFHPLLQALVGLGFVVVLWYGGVLVIEGKVTIGEFVTFNLFLNKLIWPMIAIGWVINLVQRGSASLGRIRRVLATEPAIRDEPPLVALPASVEGTIVYDDLDFRYQDAGPLVLEGIDLTVGGGDTVAVVGRTGAGKTTLLSLIPRLLDPPPETLFLDGSDVRQLPLARLRAQIAMVPQETFLFSTTIRENIAIGGENPGDAEVAHAAELAGLEADLAGFPRGLDTLVGERGITLSGGQKQRVALARALVREPRILLLDDCLSAVDTHTEERILGNLQRVFPGRTVVMVSHRVSAVRGADLIVVLERGRIAERGTHGELVAAAGLYADLAERQRLEDELAAI